jgi:hypothetical protein
MGRSIKHTVEYFSHDANASQGKTLTILENNYGIAGYAAWFKLLEVLSTVDNHIFTCRNLEDREYLAARLKLKVQDLDSILGKMAELDAIDKDLWKHGIIWSQNFVLRLKSVYDNRRQPLPTRPSFNISTPNLQTETQLLGVETPLLGVETPQRKEVKEGRKMPAAAVETCKDIFYSFKNESRYAGIDFENDFAKMCEWYHGKKKKVSNPKLACHNWLDDTLEKMSKNNGHNKQQAPASMYKYVSEEVADDN